MNWKKVEYSKNKIKAAGNAIAKNDYTKIYNEESLSIINNWRAAHAFPLQVFYVNCRNKANHFTNAIAVQRLKRLDSIVGKLQRTPDMSLTRMQDLGGCRMIMDSIDDVYKVVEEFKGSRIRHKLVREYDYIENPKTSGYRSVHLVYSYDSDKKTDYNGMFIEVQIRTHLQHLWATSVEVLGLYTRHNMKASKGDIRKLRYMELVSALFSLEEGTALSANVPQTRKDILEELNTLKDTNILDIIQAVITVIDYKDQNPTKINEGYYIMAINFDLQELLVHYYKKTEIDIATEEYERLENEEWEHRVNAVLVSAQSMDILKRAYPNYFVDVRSFVDKVMELTQ